jgi:hypothetical protein
MLNEGQQKEALAVTKYMVNNILHNKHAINASALYGVNILNAIPHAHPAWPEKFSQYEWIKQSGRFNDSVERKRNQLRRAPEYLEYEAIRFSQEKLSSDSDRLRFLQKVDAKLAESMMPERVNSDRNDIER